jgi:Ca2+-binding RTX toxin-like protein
VAVAPHQGTAGPTATVAALPVHASAAPRAKRPHSRPLLNRLDGGEQNDVVLGASGNDLIHGFGGDDRLYGGAGDDVLIGGIGDDVLYGDTGDDRLVGSAGNDTLEGGSGNDVLEGGEGDDTYVFAKHFGHDVVRERARERPGRDVLAFDDLQQADARVEREGDDLLVRDKRSDDSVRVEGFFGAEHHRVETLRFADGSVASLTGLTEAPRVLLLAAN